MIFTSLFVALSWACISAVLFVLTFIFYLAIIKLQETNDSGLLDRVHLTVRWLAYSILLVGLILDTLLNWIFLTVTFMEFPRELLATTRIVRHKYHGKGWRHLQSIWWCKNWLSPFDLDHCDIE
jgi:hypothetical protein